MFSVFPTPRACNFLSPAVILCILLPACADRSKADLPVFAQLNEGLEQSSQSIHVSTQHWLKELEDKMYDPSSRDRAQAWHPIAASVTHYSKLAFDTLEELKNTKAFTAEKMKALYANLKKYKEDILNADTMIRVEFANSIMIEHTYSKGSEEEQQQKFYSTFFKNSSDDASLAMLSKLQNSVRISENKLVGFCNAKVGSMGGCGIFDPYVGLVGQNSQQFSPGGILELSAGICSFNKTAQPSISVNGKIVEVNYEGYAYYKMKVPEKAGKYKVPVRIAYKDQVTGKEEIKEINVEYTVAKPCDQ